VRKDTLLTEQESGVQFVRQRGSLENTVRSSLAGLCSLHQKEGEASEIFALGTDLNRRRVS
jgi:hypothetical protein